jgi:hypothetical protein
MKKIDDLNWGEFKIIDIFTISPGVRLTKADMLEGNTPFIGASDSNNGITTFCGNDNDSRDNNVLGVNYNGSIVENFYHPYSALFSDDVKRLHLKDTEGNKYIYLFIKQCILKQKPKYEYGYKFNAERMKDQIILLPICDNGTPDYNFMEEYMKQVEKKLLTRYKNYLHAIEQPHLNGGEMKERKWKEFDVKAVFPNIMRGRRLKTDDHIVGSMPYVSSSAVDNGVDNYVSNNQGVRIFDNCLTIANSGSVGATFYHPYSFVASDHVTSLANQIFNKYTYLFVGSITSRLSEKYSFNREIKDSRLQREKMMLPVNDNDEPDFKYMEEYMRRIEYRLINRYIDKRLNALK